MKFEHTPMQPDGGGVITVFTENATEVVGLNDHFKIFDRASPESLVSLAGAIKTGTLAYHSSWPRKRPWYRLASALDARFVTPYTELLRRMTGYDGVRPALDLTPWHPRRLCPTHLTAACGLADGCYTFDVLVQGEPWNGMDAATYAEKLALDYAQEDVGWRPFEPEYVDDQRGRIVRNPNYLKRHACRPGLGAPWLWAALFEWWRRTHATDRQRELLARSIVAKNKAGLKDNDFDLRHGGSPQAYPVGTAGLTVSYDPVEIVKWEDFARREA